VSSPTIPPIYGGGISYGTLNNSLVVFNLAMRGGGAYYATLNNCTVINNYTLPFFQTRELEHLIATQETAS